jgi:hypothetical protein
MYFNGTLWYVSWISWSTQTMARPCIICSDSAKLAKAAEMIAAGESDQTVASALNAMTPNAPAMSYMAVLRHRRNHIVAPAKALAEAAGKGREVAEQRAQVLAAAEAGDPAAFVALSNIVTDLRKVHERLERTAAAAETDNQRIAVASLSGQQLRAAEVRAKIGGVGGYAAPKAVTPGEGQTFSITIILGDQQTTISATQPAAAVQSGGEDVIDVLPEPADEGGSEFDEPA